MASEHNQHHHHQGEDHTAPPPPSSSSSEEKTPPPPPPSSSSSAHHHQTPPPKKEHPMVPVPNAIRTVLQQTALSLLTRPPVPTANDDDDDDDDDNTNINIAAETEILSLYPNYTKVLHRILAEDVTVPEPGYPTYDASIMDGYAINSTEMVMEEGDGGWTHDIVGGIYAGDDVDLSAKDEKEATKEKKDSGDATTKPTTDAEEEEGEKTKKKKMLPTAIYITTGALVPKPYDCVIPIEECTISSTGTMLSISSTAKIGDGVWIRKVGCDMKAHDVVLAKGDVLDSVGIALCVQVGIVEVVVRKMPKVGILSTGNELLPPTTSTSVVTTTISNTNTKVGHIPDANRPLLLSLLSTYQNCVPIDLGIQGDDDLLSLTHTLLTALDANDVIITTGGISKGEKDVMEKVFVDKLGCEIHFGRLHMKPGKPTTFLTVDIDGIKKLIFALPGNPVSAFVCTELVVRPCLDMLHRGGGIVPSSYETMVRNARVHNEITAILTTDLKLDMERPEYHRVKIQYRPNTGKFVASSTGVQRSSRLMSLRDADGLMVLPQGVKGKRIVARRGEEYTVLLLRNDNDGNGGILNTTERTTMMRLEDSVHISGKRLHISIIQIVKDTNETTKKDDSESEGIKNIESIVLETFQSDTIRVLSTECLEFDTYEQKLVDLITRDDPLREQEIDLFLVICSNLLPFQSNLDVSATVQQKIIYKNADAMALQARMGAASYNGKSALFEVVIGTCGGAKNNGGGAALVMCLPQDGLVGALKNVKGLVNHAIEVGKGKHIGGMRSGSSSHHHSHSHHHHH